MIRTNTRIRPGRRPPTGHESHREPHGEPRLRSERIARPAPRVPALPLTRFLQVSAWLLCLAPACLMAATFTANSTADLVDNNPGDGICAANPDGDCTLRAAIMETNALGGEDTIELLAGTYTLSLVGNDDTALQGDLDILGDLIIEGAGRDATVVDANQIDRVFHALAGVIISDLTIRNGRVDATTFQGGGILVDDITNCTLQRVRLADNMAEAGGAIRAFNGSMVTIEDSLLTGNGLMVLGQTNTDGTAFFCRDCHLLLLGTTVSGNLGGDYAITVHDDTLTMQNSTVSGNAEGGVRVQNADAVITFSTLADNGSGVNLSYFSFEDSNFVQVSASILQNAAADNCAPGDLPVSGGYNVLDDASCAFTATGDLQNASAELGPLQDNGGPTPTHRPAESSPVVDAVPLSECNTYQSLPLIADQRGFGRPVGPACDSGAVEVVRDQVFSDGFEDALAIGSSG